MLITIDASEVHDLARDLRFGADNIELRAGYVVAKGAHDVEASAKQNLIDNDSVDTGTLLNSLSSDVFGLAFEVGPTAYYGGFVEEGTDGPYLIENAFGWGITVEHPGNTPKPYLAPAFDRHLPNIERALGALGVETVMGRAL